MAEIEKGTVIDIEVRSDGVYMVIDCTEPGQKPGRKEVLDAIEKFAVQDIDFVSVNNIFKSEDDHIEMKISSNTKIKLNNEIMTIEISKNRLEARVKFSEPYGKGTMLSKESILQQLRDAGVVHGIDNDMIDELIEEKEYGKPYVIAVGTPQEDGTDGYLEYHFDLAASSRKPKILEDGSVDFHQLSIVKQCGTGEVLITAIPAIDGKEGMDVTGKVLPFKKGKMPPVLPRGKNVHVSETGLQLVAEVDGQIVFANNKLDVSPILEISTNVDNSTGDIDFRGTVVVKGNVVNGFTIKAFGNIEIMGVVEGAVLQSESNILLCSGVQGADKAKITAAGNITAKFLESCQSVTAGGTITADSILHSNISCGDSLIVSGKKGCVVGGKIVVRNTITANIIGSSMATPMEIEVGHMPERLEEFRALNTEFAQIVKEYEQVAKVVDVLTELNEKAPLTDEKKAVLIKAVHSKVFHKNKMTQLQIRLDELKQLLASRSGLIDVSKVIHNGVKILIGDATLYVRDSLTACKLFNEDGRIVVKY